MSWNVSSVMTPDVVTVSPLATYKEIALRMSEHRVSALPVVDQDGRVAGLVSQADLLLKEERPAAGPGGPLIHPHGDAARATGRNAAAVMTSPAVTIGPEATLTEAARLMHRRRVKRLPVVDRDGRLLGIVSRSDLLRPYLRSDESVAREVREDVARRMLAIDPEALRVEVQDGVVRLHGTVETRSLATILTRLVERVEGVVGVDDRLAWKLDDRNIDLEPPPLAMRLSADERA